MGGLSGRPDHVRHLEARRTRQLIATLDRRRRRARRTAGRDAGARGDGFVPRPRRSVAGLHARWRHLRGSPRTSCGPLSRNRRSTTGSRRTPCKTVRARRSSNGRLVDCAESGSPGDVLRTRHGGRVVVRHDLGSPVPAGGGRGCRRPADLRHRHGDLRLDDGVEPRRIRRRPRACTSSSPRSRARARTADRARFPGTLLNQYAMSEYDGVLRVATTVSERRGWVKLREVTEGVVTTLREQDGALRQLGQVGGLGQAGQRVDPSRAVHRGPRIRRDLPPDRSALRARPARCCRPEGPRRAEDPRLLGLPASDR